MTCIAKKNKTHNGKISVLFVIVFSVSGNIIYAQSSVGNEALLGPGTTIHQGVPLKIAPTTSGNETAIDISGILTRLEENAILTGADKIAEEILEAVLSSDSSSETIRIISNRVGSRIADLDLKAGAGSIASFGKDVLIGTLIDIIAEEAMDYQLRRGGSFSTVKAAASYVLIKQAYIVSTSKGPAGIVVGQAGLLRDIFIKDVQAIQEYNSATAMADYAALRADMWEAYAEYVNLSDTAITPLARQEAKEIFISDLRQIADRMGIMYSSFLGEYPRPSPVLGC